MASNWKIGRLSASGEIGSEIVSRDDADGKAGGGFCGGGAINERFGMFVPDGKAGGAGNEGGDADCVWIVHEHECASDAGEVFAGAVGFGANAGG